MGDSFDGYTWVLYFLVARVPSSQALSRVKHNSRDLVQMNESSILDIYSCCLNLGLLRNHVLNLL